jgi:hypothetical protein
MDMLYREATSFRLDTDPPGTNRAAHHTPPSHKRSKSATSDLVGIAVPYDESPLVRDGGAVYRERFADGCEIVWGGDSHRVPLRVLHRSDAADIVWQEAVDAGGLGGYPTPEGLERIDHACEVRDALWNWLEFEARHAASRADEELREL